MQEIISPIERSVLIDELQNKATLLRHSRKGGTDLYIFKAADCPQLMQEVGRLREIAFREAGGGTGFSVDIDMFDTMDKPYWQLIVWDPADRQILGGYRYIFGPDIQFDAEGQPVLATSHMFHFSDRFIKDYLPYMLELGRSFVIVDHQSSRSGAKGLFTLDNLWDGLGALAVTLPECRYYYGKFTMYTSYPKEGRNMILYFIQKHFPDHDRLVYPYEPLQTGTDVNAMQQLFVHDNFKDDYRILNAEVRKFGYNIPPLVNAYMCLSPTMKTFGTAINDEFGDVEESGILITIADIWKDKHERYIESFVEEINKIADILKIVG
ncbi:MAG: GNAT family N-acetyltransferase [Bacteroidales bacterium]|nr:GNAT family N-acetyltransferase [Candidatus Liminaster caballi]